MSEITAFHSAPSRRRVLVDLRGLETGGSSGGLQTYVTWLLPWLILHHRDEFAFLALARIQNGEQAASLLGDEDAVWVESVSNGTLQEAGHGRPAGVACSLPPGRAIRNLGVETIYEPRGPLPFTPQGFTRSR